MIIIIIIIIIIHKIFVIKEKFLVFLNLLRGPDITRSGRTACCASLWYTIIWGRRS